jgi:hypothetical protein
LLHIMGEAKPRPFLCSLFALLRKTIIPGHISQD